MVNVVRKRCAHPGCNKQATYGVQGSNTAEFCAPHAGGGMVNVVKKRCAHPGCTKQPLYGVEGSKTTEFCSTHAEAGMVDARNKKRCAVHEAAYQTPVKRGHFLGYPALVKLEGDSTVSALSGAAAAVRRTTSGKQETPDGSRAVTLTGLRICNFGC